MIWLYQTELDSFGACRKRPHDRTVEFPVHPSGLFEGFEGSGFGVLFVHALILLQAWKWNGVHALFGMLCNGLPHWSFSCWMHERDLPTVAIAQIGAGTLAGQTLIHEPRDLRIETLSSTRLKASPFSSGWKLEGLQDGRNVDCTPAAAKHTLGGANRSPST